MISLKRGDITTQITTSIKDGITYRPIMNVLLPSSLPPFLKYQHSNHQFVYLFVLVIKTTGEVEPSPRARSLKRETEDGRKAVEEKSRNQCVAPTEPTNLGCGLNLLVAWGSLPIFSCNYFVRQI